LRSRHCERSEAIHLSLLGDMDCFAALAMTAKVSMTAKVGLAMTVQGHGLVVEFILGRAFGRPAGSQ